jgi:hypothetical protein
VAITLDGQEVDDHNNARCEQAPSQIAAIASLSSVRANVRWQAYIRELDMGANAIRLARTRRDPLRMFVQVNGTGTARCYGGSTPLHPLITLPAEYALATVTGMSWASARRLASSVWPGTDD